jgi:hypothetical protein
MPMLGNNESRTQRPLPLGVASEEQMLIMEPDGRMVRYPVRSRSMTPNAVLHRWWRWATAWTGRQHRVHS